MTNQVLTWNDISTTGTAVAFDNFDDAHSLPVNIGFDFEYSGGIFSQFVINTNGFIKLGNIHPADSVQFFDYPRGTSNGPVGDMNGIFKSQHFADVYLISPFNHDLQPGTGTPEINVLTEGVPGNRVCTIQFKNFQDKIEPPDRQYNNMQFQIKLHESGVVDFVWGTWEPSANLSYWRAAAVGLKGSSAAENEMLTITKSSNATWQTIVPRIGNYCATCNAYNFGNPTRPQPEAGRTYTFYPKMHQDASVQEIYTLGKLPIPYGLPHVIKAYIKNSGLDTLTNLPVNLDISGTNPFSATNTVPLLEPDSVIVVEFPGFQPTLQGFNTVTVTVPPDQYTFDDTNAFAQEITNDKYSYCDTNDYHYCIGMIYVPGPGSPACQWLSKFHINGKKNITEARIGLGNGDGQTVYAVLLNSYGYKIAQSPDLTLTSENIWKPYTFEFYNPPVIENSDFYIGLMQTQSFNTYLPMGFQVEDPQRRGAYYTSISNGIVNESFGGNARFVVEAAFDTGYCFPHFSATTSCQPGGISLITAFSTSEGVTNIHDTVAICNGNPGNYTIYPNQVVTAEQGTSFNFAASGNDNMWFDLYADWNSDGDYYDPGELIYSHNVWYGACCMTGTIEIPLSAAIGNTRLRFMGRSHWTGGPPDPCGDFGAGETRDYTLTILPATSMNIQQSTTFQCDTTSIVSRNAVDVPIIGIKIKAGGALNPLAVSSFILSAAGCSNFSNDVSMAHLYYTGNNPVFSTSHLFGSSSDLNFPITGMDTLKNGWNYFWLTFDVSGNATIGDFLDAGCVDFFVENEGNYSPSVSFPPGKLTIDYCIPEFSDKQGCMNNGYGISNFSTTGGVTNISNLNSGCPVNNTDYTYFQDQTVTAEQGYPFRFDASSDNWVYFQIFADWNQDADFDDPGEFVSSTYGNQTTGTILVPEWAEIGQTRLRVIGFWSQDYPSPDGNKSPLDEGCPYIWGWGETEDYNLNVLPGTPMIFQSGTTFQCDTLPPVTRGSVNNPIIMIRINTTGGLSPYSVSSFTIGSSGSSNFQHDVSMVQIFYTGSDSVFSSAQLFGSATSLSAPLTGTRQLLPGPNFFWVAYNVRDTAAIGNDLDATCNEIMVGSNTIIPSITTPPGHQIVDYCIPSFRYQGNCITGYGTDDFSTTGAISNNSNLDNGCPANLFDYSKFTNQVVTAQLGSEFQVHLKSMGSDPDFSVYIDWNHNYWFDATEQTYIGWGNIVDGTISVPSNALLGPTRLRVISSWEESMAPTFQNECFEIRGGGEVEDYTIDVVAAVPATTTVQNVTVPASHDTCFNATQTITVAGNGTSFVVQNGGSASFIAGQKITFKPVSKVWSGGYLHAWITTGNNYCNLVMTPVMIAVKDLEAPDSESGSADNEKLTSGSFSVYPNPTSGIFTIGFRENPAEQQARVQCYNILGSELIDQFIDTAFRHEFSLLGEQPGVYLLKVTMNGEVYTRKIVRR